MIQWKSKRATCSALLRRHPVVQKGAMLVFCATGLLISFSAYAYMLETLTIAQHRPNEFGLMFICCAMYTVLSLVATLLFREPTTAAPIWTFLILSATTFASSYTSIRALRHVSYPIKVLGKTCKPIPIMAIGLCLGKTYPVRKYVSIGLITLGASLFIVFNSSESSMSRENSAQGVLLLCISLLFDGATGALEDKFMKQFRIGPFNLMYQINRFSTVLAAIAIGVTPLAVPEVVKLMQSSPGSLFLLGLAGGFGQIFIFLTISLFGALTTSVLGSARKMLTIVLSVYLFQHELNSIQYLALVVVFGGMVVNLARKRTENDVDEIEMQSLMATEDEQQLERMNVPSEIPSQVFTDLGDALFADKDNVAFSAAIDTVFRATTSA